VGTIEFRSIIEPIRNLAPFRYYQAECRKIDINGNKIYCINDSNEFEMTYDYLIISIGEKTKTFNIPGVKDNAYFLREATDARKIRIKIIDCFEDASVPGISEEQRKMLTTFIVVGGGPTGVEFAAELYDFIEEDVQKKYPMLAGSHEVILIEALDKLLSSFDQKLSEYTYKLFKRQNVNVMTKTIITKVEKNKVTLTDNTVIPFGVIVWATGNEALELTVNTDLPKTNTNKIIVNNNMKVIGHENIFAIGDCAQIANNAFPSTAQTAQQEGKYLAKYLTKTGKGKKYKDFKYKNFGMLAYVGNQKALADMNHYKGSGFATYIFWRSVYFTKLVSFKNKILVLFDWFKAFAFGRDVSNF
jgi:NADH:ubiquinone reductase (non-electrogenic)